MRVVILILFFLFNLSGLKAVTSQDSVIIPISVQPGLQFDIVRFKVKPGAKVKIVFTNTDDMDHNFLITAPGRREDVVMAALKLGEKGPSMNYIPQSDKVLWSIAGISPHQEKLLTFTAPDKAGVYPYVCTYPGHGFVMYGAMYVTTNKNLPDLEEDMNIPPARRQADNTSTAEKGFDTHLGHSMLKPKPLHPYTPLPPYLYRVFIDGSSPAAIAVNLSNNLSYCWDAGTCKLRFAWTGGFLDNTDLWKGKGDALAKLMGKVFFRDSTTYPIHFKNSKNLPVLSYKGYKLINRYPEFHYTVDRADVYELVTPTDDGTGIIRSFRIPKLRNQVWFEIKAEDGIGVGSSAGTWTDGILSLSAEQGKNFNITITKKVQGSL